MKLLYKPVDSFPCIHSCTYCSLYFFSRRSQEKQKPKPNKSGKKRTMFTGKRGKGAGKTKSTAKPSGGKGKRLKSGGGRKRR